MMITRTIKALVAMLLLGAMALLAAPAAEAHAELKSSDPAENASLTTAPTSVTLTFDDAVTLPNDAIKVVGPNGASWTVGTPRADEKVVTAPVQATGPAGAYQLVWKVRADDGDIEGGTIPFTLTAAAVPAAAPAAAPASPAAAAPQAAAAPAPQAAPAPAPQNAAQQSSSGVPAWVWVLVAVVLAAAVIGAVVRARRGSGADQGARHGSDRETTRV